MRRQNDQPRAFEPLGNSRRLNSAVRSQNILDPGQFSRVTKTNPLNSSTEFQTMLPLELLDTEHLQPLRRVLNRLAVNQMKRLSWQSQREDGCIAPLLLCFGTG